MVSSEFWESEIIKLVFPSRVISPVTILLFFNSLVQRGDPKLHEAELHAAVGTALFSVWQGIQDFFLNLFFNP